MQNILISSPTCFRNNEKIISSFKPTTAKLYQKQYWRFCCKMQSIKMQTIITYSIVTVITEFSNDNIYLVRIIYRFGLYISSSSIKQNVTPVVPTVCPVILVLAVGVSLVLAL